MGKPKSKHTAAMLEDAELHWTQWRKECQRLREEKDELTSKFHDVLRTMLDYFEVNKFIDHLHAVHYQSFPTTLIFLEPFGFSIRNDN